VRHAFDSAIIVRMGEILWSGIDSATFGSSSFLSDCGEMDLSPVSRASHQFAPQIHSDRERRWLTDNGHGFNLDS